MKTRYQAPYLRACGSTKEIMQNVVLSLVPALCGSVFFFGIRALGLTLFSAAVCVLSEYAWQKITKRQITAWDFSAAATGMLLAFNMPVSTPLWVLLAADLFAILVVKQMFGGIGCNFVNPALMGRLFVMTVWPGQIMRYTMPHSDAVSSATALAALKDKTQSGYTYLQMFLGDIPGAIGETSKILILIGFLYLCRKGIVNAKAALVYIGSVSVLTFVFGGEGLFAGDFLGNLLGGGLILGGCYMLTDYAFVSQRGRLLSALAAGVITAWIRIFGPYPEGVCLGIVTANCLAGVLAMAENRRVYGTAARHRSLKIGDGGQKGEK